MSLVLCDDIDLGTVVAAVCSRVIVLLVLHIWHGYKCGFGVTSRHYLFFDSQLLFSVRKKFLPFQYRSGNVVEFSIQFALFSISTAQILASAYAFRTTVTFIDNHKNCPVRM